MFVKYGASAWTCMFLNFVGDFFGNVLSPTMVTESTTNISRSGLGFRAKRPNNILNVKVTRVKTVGFIFC